MLLPAHRCGQEINHDLIAIGKLDHRVCLILSIPACRYFVRSLDPSTAVRGSCYDVSLYVMANSGRKEMLLRQETDTRFTGGHSPVLNTNIITIAMIIIAVESIVNALCFIGLLLGTLAKGFGLRVMRTCSNGGPGAPRCTLEDPSDAVSSGFQQNYCA